MSRTINRPATNITAPTQASPRANAMGYGVKVARAVTRNAWFLREMLAGPIESRTVAVKDRYTFQGAGLTVQDGTQLSLTDAGRTLAESL